MRTSSSDENSFAIDDSLFGTRPRFCMEITWYDSISSTPASIMRSAISFFTLLLSEMNPWPLFSRMKVTRSFTISECEMLVAMPERSKSSVVVPTYQPRFSSPIMFFAGTRTLSKNTSLKSWLFAMLTSGRTLMPGDFISTMK